MEIFTAPPPEIGTHNMGFSAQFPAKEEPGNLRPNLFVFCENFATRKARLRKDHFSGDFLGVFDLLRSACSLGIPQENPLNLRKSLIFTNTPCKSTCLYNAPSMHTVELLRKLLSFDLHVPKGMQTMASKPWFEICKRAEVKLRLRRGKEEVQMR